MFVSFDSLPDHARLWVYQSNRKLSSSEKNIISQSLESFTNQWEVHGQPMKASFKLFFDQFVVLAADEGFNAASGCSIDGSVRVLKNLGSQFEIDFFDRSHIAFKKDEEILLIPMHELKGKSIQGEWSKETLVFNNLIAAKGDIDGGWLLPAGSTWLNRYLPREAASL